MHVNASIASFLRLYGDRKDRRQILSDMCPEFRVSIISDLAAVFYYK